MNLSISSMAPPMKPADTAAARFSFAGFVAEVFDGADHQRDRHDDEHREGRDQEEEDLEGHVSSVTHYVLAGRADVQDEDACADDGEQRSDRCGSAASL